MSTLVIVLASLAILCAVVLAGDCVRRMWRERHYTRPIRWKYPRMVYARRRD